MRRIAATLAVVVALLISAGSAESVVDGNFKPGQVFRDCPECPEMVVVPAGEYTMGSPESETERLEDREGPVHRVSVRQPFAIGKFEVTFAEWNACVAGGGCEGYRPSDLGWGRGKRPVIKVNYEDAKSYANWLSRKTGHAYRLPSEAEWEYAARAGTKMARYWGVSADDACGYANVHDRTSKRVNKFSWTHHDCDDGYANTAPVGSFEANLFSLHDMLGNVWEWTEDCWNESYTGAPVDANVWKAGDCSRRVLRGGSWLDEPRNARSALRHWFVRWNRSYVIGFRISRTLP